jgi:hypothetical protein
MFKQFHIEDLGTDPKTFDLENFGYMIITTLQVIKKKNVVQHYLYS